MTSLASKVRPVPRILIVDDEPSLVELIGDVVNHGIGQVVSASNVEQARHILATQDIELLVADLHLPDGDGMSLLPALRHRHPLAGAIVITGSPSVDGAIHALHEGALDFLPKPFTADDLRERLCRALTRQRLAARTQKRLARLHDAVRRLNAARKVVSKKVDLLCNDLITAYGELSRQLHDVRTQEDFRKILAQSKDLEQMLCYAMDWMLRQFGYTNVALWLASDDHQFQLGAYMKYTIPGEPEFTQTMLSGLLPLLSRRNMLHLSADEAADVLTPDELTYMKGQTVLGSTCSYLGETLAVVVLFRDGKIAFTEEHAEVLRAISPIFALALASKVHSDQPPQCDGGVADPDDESDKSKPRDDSSDWWKRGEAPPF